MSEYRIHEYMDEFTIQIRLYKMCGPFWNRRKVYGWYKVSPIGSQALYMNGRPYWVLRSFDNLDEAQKVLAQFKKGVTIHEA